MSSVLLIKAGEQHFKVKLNNSKTARQIVEALPFEERAEVWGEEVYFPAPVNVIEETSTEVLDAGDAAFWPEGSCLCIFFGPTPLSSKGEIRAAGPVYVIGKVFGDFPESVSAMQGRTVRVERA